MLNSPLVAFDIETSNGRGSGSLNPRDPESFIGLYQFAFEDGSIVLKRGEEGIDLVNKLIEENYTFIIHNAFFEADWLLVKHSVPIEKMNFWCTMLASQILNAGKNIPDKASWVAAQKNAKNLDYVGRWNPLMEENDQNITNFKKPGRFSHNLQAVVYRYSENLIEKDQGDSDWGREKLREDQLRYAKDDVRYLIDVALKQKHFVEQLNLSKIIDLEMKLIPATVDMKDQGMKINVDNWRKSSEEYLREAEELETELNYSLGMELAEREDQESLFGNHIVRDFKVSSASQLAKFFNVDSADEQHLRQIDHPLIHKILRYKENFKIASTYGDGYLKYIDDVDSRIHSLLVQAETATGRFSSRKPNLQNIPGDMLKGFLSYDEGNLLVTIDYSSVESRILAYASGDPEYIKSVNSSDVHWENAKNIFGLPEDAKRSDVFFIEAFDKSIKGDELRRMSKGVSFGIPYGISAVGLVSRGFAENADQGQDLIDNFLGKYKKVDEFLKQSVIEALSRGYTQDNYGRIRWYQKPEVGEVEEEELRTIEKSIARQAQNHKIQSLSASVTKKAILDVYNYLKTTGQGRVVLTVHDSIFFEINMSTANETIPKIAEIMEKAGPEIFSGMETPVDIDVGYKQKRSCAITGLPFSVYSHIWDGEKVLENPEFLEPRVKAILENLHHDVNDIQGGLEVLYNFVKTRNTEWISDNKDLVNKVKNIYENQQDGFSFL